MESRECDAMLVIESSWGETVDVVADVWVLEGDRRLVTERGARRLADERARRKGGKSGNDPAEPFHDASGASIEWGHEFGPDFEAETLAEIARDEAQANEALEEHLDHDFPEHYLRFLVARGATSLHVALVNRILSRVNRALGWSLHVCDLIDSRKAELVVTIRAMTVSAELGARLVAFLAQLRSYMRLHGLLLSGQPGEDLPGLEGKAFDPALSMTRPDADLLEAALLAAARTELDARAAIAALIVLETGIGASELSRLTMNRFTTGRDGGQLLDCCGSPAHELSPALSGYASALVERNRALRDFSGSLTDDQPLFQARESVRNRSLAASWFTASLRAMSRDLCRAGLQRRRRSLDMVGLHAHHERRREDRVPGTRGFAEWSRRVASTAAPERAPRRPKAGPARTKRQAALLSGKSSGRGGKAGVYRAGVRPTLVQVSTGDPRIGRPTNLLRDAEHVGPGGG